jgi:AraC family transcriptional regulator
MKMKEGCEATTIPTEVRWNGVGVSVFHRHWIAGAGRHMLTSEKAALYVILDEVGGRCEFRSALGEVPTDYLGPQALGFAPAGDSLVLYPCRSREVRIASFSFCIEEINLISPMLGTRIQQAGPKLMFNDERIRDCAVLLAAECEVEGNPPRYGEGLALSLVAAVADATSRSKSVRAGRLNYRQFTIATEYIEEHLAHPVLLEAVAVAVGLAPSKFAGSFRHATGMSLQRWHMRARVHRAQRMMLDDPAQPFTEIAFLLGFADQSHFSRTFKQLIGWNPREWLRSRS